MKQQVTSNIDLEQYAGGAFAEKLNDAIMQVAENIQNPNTEPTNKRQSQIVIKFTPNKSRTMVSTSIMVTTKLAATEAIETQMIMGVNVRSGQVEIAEYDGQIQGQISMLNMKGETKGQESVPAASADSQPQIKQPEAAPTGKPIDLKKRNSGEPVATQEPYNGLIPGKDFDPETGEIYQIQEADSNPANRTQDEQPENSNNVITINQKSKQA